MQASEFEVLVRAPLDLTFSIYADVERWRNRSVFGEHSLGQGHPVGGGQPTARGDASPRSEQGGSGGAALFRQREC